MKKKRKLICSIVLAVLMIVPFVCSILSDSPEWSSYSSDYYDVDDFSFIYDLSYQKDGQTVREHNIFKENLRLISEAEKYIIADLFLFNDEYDKTKGEYPSFVKDYSDALILKKQQNPEMPIVLITDPINNFYGAYEQKHITRLKEVGVQVVITELDELKDSNPLLSGFYRCYTNWLGTSGMCWLPNFFEKGKDGTNLRAVIKLANFKANHRKVLITDKEAIVSSANPHDASGYHSNVAVRMKGALIGELIESEMNVIRMSGGVVPDVTYENVAFDSSNAKIRLITEKAIFDALVDNIDKSDAGDEIRIGIFYISDFDLLASLGAAADRGVDIRIVADPNKDAFGIEKNGSPNRSALCSLSEKHNNIDVRWYATNGEQYHGKTAVFNFKDEEETRVIIGSSNFTRRNFKGFNLETDVEIIMKRDDQRAEEINAYFERIWNNNNGVYTLPIDEYYEDSVFKDVIWRIQEATGLCRW